MSMSKREVVHNNVLKREFLPPAFLLHPLGIDNDVCCPFSPVNVNVHPLLLLLRCCLADESLDNKEYLSAP